MSFGDDQICGHSTIGDSTAGGKTIAHAQEPHYQICKKFSKFSKNCQFFTLSFNPIRPGIFGSVRTREGGWQNCPQAIRYFLELLNEVTNSKMG